MLGLDTARLAPPGGLFAAGGGGGGGVCEPFERSWFPPWRGFREYGGGAGFVGNVGGVDALGGRQIGDDFTGVVRVGGAGTDRAGTGEGRAVGRGGGGLPGRGEPRGVAWRFCIMLLCVLTGCGFDICLVVR